MAGGYYTALSGLQTRLEVLDRLASDIANAGTAGYKAERATTSEARRPSFGAELQSAIDVAGSAAQLDLRAGNSAQTGRPLDVTIEGDGFFVISTDAGDRYTRNGRFSRRADGVLATPDGQPVLGEDGPITLGTGVVQIDPDGTVRHEGATAGKLQIVSFADPTRLARETSLRLRNQGAAPTRIERPSLASGALEQSNVSVVERLAELTTASRSFESLQRALSTLMNEVDNRVITEFGRR
jgi:flagellar basal body rod protein FlgG